MSKYVDGFVLVVPKDKTEEYKKMAQDGADMWMRLGALEYFECRGDDLKPQEMGDQKTRSFVEMAGAGSDETVWFSFIVFESKEHRDQVNAKVMEEMNKDQDKYKDMSVPFDMRRMAYGGFEAVVEK
ncbi:MAG: hypothetical protein BroJett025_07780 [Patescibacteria group bacterium]|nr:MAG: hypothetical protein BroJett025_07780 [Patescibacteria group bacterium]